jgi:hypothetical protein
MQSGIARGISALTEPFVLADILRTKTLDSKGWSGINEV